MGLWFSILTHNPRTWDRLFYLWRWASCWVVFSSPKNLQSRLGPDRLCWYGRCTILQCDRWSPPWWVMEVLWVMHRMHGCWDTHRSRLSSFLVRERTLQLGTYYCKYELLCAPLWLDHYVRFGRSGWFPGSSWCRVLCRTSLWTVHLFPRTCSCWAPSVPRCDVFRLVQLRRVGGSLPRPLVSGDAYRALRY